MIRATTTRTKIRERSNVDSEWIAVDSVRGCFVDGEKGHRKTRCRRTAKKVFRALMIGCFGFMAVFGSDTAFSANKPVSPGIVMPMTSTGKRPSKGALQELSWSPDGSQIVFTAWRKGKSGLFIADRNGQKAVYLTAKAEYAFHPVWAPDGKSVYFSALKAQDNADICRVGLDGKDLMCLTKGATYDAMPAVSPDGGTVTFCKYEKGVPYLYSMGPKGEAQTKYYDQPACFSAWSPDGKSVAFVADHQLIITDVKTHKSKKVTFDLLEAEWCQDTTPVWNPKSNRLAFLGAYQAFSSEIYTISPTGKKIRKISDNLYEDFRPSWSADGKRVVYATFIPEGTTEIFTAQQDTPKDQKRLTKNHSMDMEPVFSPDGKSIVFTRTIRGRGTLYIMDSDGKNERLFFKNDTILSKQLDIMDRK